MKFIHKGLILLACAMLSACSSADTNHSSLSSSPAVSATQNNALEQYTVSCSAASGESSYTAAIRSSYTLTYSNSTSDPYSMDGVIAMQNEDSDPTAHITQHISSNGINSVMEGYYYGGRLYNTYNGINYYEDMDVSALKSTMMMPLTPYTYEASDVSTISVSHDNDGNTVYEINLNTDSAEDIFSSRYDQYGFSDYDDYQISDNIITDTFDENGNFRKETASFSGSVSYSGQTVELAYEGSVEYADGDTEVVISDEQRQSDESYIAYNEIDPSSISSETIDDSAEATVTETFRKRLMNRLGYEEADDGTLRDTFNTNMMYMIDFNSCTFEYVNYSIAYVYNWKTDTGAMNACTYDFNTGNASSQCEDSTVETIQEVKNYLQMELYYCGLSLEDLQREA